MALSGALAAAAAQPVLMRSLRLGCGTSSISTSAKTSALRRGSRLVGRAGSNPLPSGMYGTSRVQPAGTFPPHYISGITAADITLSYGGGAGGMGGGGFGGGGWGGDSRRWGGGGDDDFGRFFSWLVENFTALLRQMGSAYGLMSKKFPILTSGMMTALSMSLAECIIQLVIMRQPELSREPLLRAVIYGLTVKGPLLSVFYGALNKAFTCRKGLNLLKLLFLDCAVGGLCFNSLYAFVMPLLKGSSIADAAQEAKNNVVGLWMVGLKVWPAAMTLNYLLLPPSLQVPYILGVDVICNVAIGLKATTTVDCAKIEAQMASGQPVSADQVEVVDVLVDAPLVDAIHALEEQFGPDVELAPSLV